MDPALVHNSDYIEPTPQEKLSSLALWNFFTVADENCSSRITFSSSKSCRSRRYLYPRDRHRFGTAARNVLSIPDIKMARKGRNLKWLCLQLWVPTMMTLKSFRSVVMVFNNEKQPIGDKAGLLSGMLGLLRSDYEKFSISKESWHKITTKYKVYKECVKETRLRLYDTFYEPTFTFEQNIKHRLPGIDREHWRKFLEYRVKAETKKNAINRSKQLYTHTGGSKSFAWQMEEESEQ
ncbi:hypothetical protein Ahy_A04g018649 isoform A [Arachis hypogaea]|uniref:Uncharacterized protein n=1 Tax=Arachis hypogaea TaxID=3818 RepID=A0A445DE74_ARAHY|nr:hypothetical protein Ahy_A04g018649 isoform A [Arachis hypogaea]